MEKRSLTWKYFSVCETDESKAQCICKTIISRGGSNTKSYSTSTLNNHLKNKHPDEYESITADKHAAADNKPGTSSTPKRLQPTLAQFSAHKRKWAIDSEEARKVHEAIGRMIAVDVQPYSVVEDVGFQNVVTTWNQGTQFPAGSIFRQRSYQSCTTAQENGFS